MSLNYGFDLIKRPFVILIKMDWIFFDYLLELRDLFRLNNFMEVFSFNFEYFRLIHDANGLRIFNFFKNLNHITVMLSNKICFSKKEILLLVLRLLHFPIVKINRLLIVAISKILRQFRESILRRHYYLGFPEIYNICQTFLLNGLIIDNLKRKIVLII